MDKNDIKNLAKYTLQRKVIEREFTEFILNKLSRRNLIYYSRYLKALIDKEKVEVVSSDPIPDSLKKQLNDKFPEKRIVYKIDRDERPGIKVTVNDSVFDFTLDGYLDQTIKSLKSSL